MTSEADRDRASAQGGVWTIEPRDVRLVKWEPRRQGDGPWPEPIGERARIGVAGDFIRAVEPTTEGDPNAILVQFLASLGCILGSKPHVLVDEKRHPLKIWLLVVGSTGSGKKGTGANRVFSLLDEVDPTWVARRKSGIASGEAIVHHVRDDEERIKRVRGPDGTVAGTAETIQGVDDKRLMLKEEEFSRVLRIARKDSSTISAAMREAWDSDLLMTTSKTAPEKATGAHVVVLGHITPQEIRRDFSALELSNGFANRFLFILSRRSKRLSRPPRLAASIRRELVGKLEAVVEHARSIPDERSEIALTEESWALWDGMKEDIERRIEAADSAGLLSARITTRGPAHVLRIAALYALLDRHVAIEPRHLEAAREIWRYSLDSLGFILGEELADRDAARLLDALAERDAQRMTRSEVNNALGGHRSSKDIDRLRDFLIGSARIEVFHEMLEKGGRVEWWVGRTGTAVAR